MEPSKKPRKVFSGEFGLSSLKLTKVEVVSVEPPQKVLFDSTPYRRYFPPKIRSLEKDF